MIIKNTSAVVIAVLMATILWLDSITHLGLTVGVLYAPVVLFTIQVRRVGFTLAVTLVAAVLVLLGASLSPPVIAGYPQEFAWLNRIMSIAAILVTGWLVVVRVRATQALTDSHRALVDARQTLSDQRHLLEVAASAGGLGGWSVDLQTGVVSWSDEVARIHGKAAGYNPASLDEAFSYYAESEQAYLRSTVQRTLSTKEPFNIESRIVLPDGQTVWVHASGRAVVNADGDVVKIEGALQDITARKIAEQASRVSLQRFQQLAESMPITVWTAAENGDIEYVTPLFFEYANVAHRRLEKDQWQHYVHPDDMPFVLEVWQRALQTGQPYEVEMRLRRADGEYRWHLARAVRVRDQVDGTLKWFGSLTEVHEQRRVAQEARDLATRLFNTLESITDAFFTLDTEWNFTYLNGQAEKLLKRDRKELIGRNVWVEFAPARGTTFEVEYRRAMKTGQPVVFEQFYPPLETWFQVHAYPSKEGLAVYFQDMTRSHNALAHLRLLETAVSRLNDVVIITEAEPINDPGPRIVYVNDAFVRRTGYSREEVIGKSPRILQGSGTSRAELDRIRQAIQNWRPVRAELLNYTKAGDEYWIEIDIVPMADDTGWYTHWVAVERDISERKLLEDRVRHLQRMDAIGQLTGGVAHDFNNLLTVMVGNAELLVESLEDRPELSTSAKMIAQAGSKGAELTKRLLAFARRQPLDPRALNASRVVTDMQSLLIRTLGEHIELEFVMGAGLWSAMADPSQLEDALLNLAINARDAMMSGGRLTIETGNVWFSSDYAREHPDLSPGQYVMIAVSDTGCGIPPENMKRLFEPFFTTKPRGQGTGLGLPMVFGFLKQSGGHMTVYSEPGQGTTVKMYLPRTTEQWVEPVAAEVESTRGGGQTILLVEDDHLVREYARSQLLGLGYNVVCAEDGKRALDILRSDARCDLLFTDVVMPGGLSGRQLADQAKLLRPGLKVLYTSGYTENAIVHHGRLDPGVLLLNKPYRRVELAEKVWRALSEPTGQEP
ncbi:MAG: hybrid sensor histidine kinase/response regulator [Pusillimonas sp.]|nr:hybrid sensor histidine kinase/response regulator [Pusillimonas sp.]|tara:strand:- start:15998 stop:19012 length:3015 start_codon:yes stop_codon:yes gene_type:complete